MNRPQAGVGFFFAFRTESLNDSTLLFPPFLSGQSEGLVLGPRERFTTKAEGPGDLIFTGRNNQQKGYIMKSFITGLLKGRRTRWSMLAAVLAVAGLTVAWDFQPWFRLGGGFVGGGGGAVWNALQIPLDPLGRTAAIQIHNVTDGPATAALLAAFDADTVTELTGQGQMISRDTFKSTWLAYATKAGSPGNSAEIRLIFVFKSTGKFTGPDSLVVNYTADVYPPSADADGDGFPDPGTTPLPIPISGTTAGKRVLP